MNDEPAYKKYPDRCHPSHDTRMSDASSYDEVCKKCGATDMVPGGWGYLRMPCTEVTAMRKEKRR